jgi:predicted DNA-binding transcriptional regulator YafY
MPGYGFGDQVEVLEPEHLRDEFAQIAQSLQDMYAKP